MKHHLMVGALLTALASAGAAWQVHTTSATALARGQHPTLLCPLAGHSATGDLDEAFASRPER